MSGSASSAAASSSSDTSESGSDGSDDGSETGTSLSCRDGVVDEGEACDDGNDIDGDGCNVDCIASGTLLDAWILDDDPELSTYPGAVKIGPDGSFVIAGSVNRTNVGHGYDAWVRKFTEDGDDVWTDEHNTLANATDGFTGVDIDDDGDIVVAGLESRGDIVEGYNVLLRRYDSDGNEAWTVTYNTADADGDDRSDGVGFDSVGDIFVGGHIVRTDLGQSANFWVAKYDGEGTNAWMSTYDNPVHTADVCSAFDVDEDGYGYCAGYSSREDLGHSLDAFVLATTPDGDTAWTHTHDAGGGNSEVLRAVAAGRDGDVVVAGAVYDGVQSDTWVRKLDASGEAVWSHTFAGEAGLNDLAEMLAVDDEGNVIVGGYEITAEGSGATWIRKLDPDGNVLWTDAVDIGPGFDGAADADAWPDGRVLVIGTVDPTGDGVLDHIWARIYAP